MSRFIPDGIAQAAWVLTSIIRQGIRKFPLNNKKMEL